jgi:hypothetical protein
MPQGIGYPSTTLAGEGGRPAIDAATGAPLTIEMLLARRGLMGYSGNHNLQQMVARQNQGDPMNNSAGGTVDDSGQMVTRTDGAGPSSLDGVDPVAPQGPTTFDPTTGLDAAEMEEIQEASMLDMLGPAAAIGGAVGAGYYLSRVLARINNRRASVGAPPVTPEVASSIAASTGSNSMVAPDVANYTIEPEMPSSNIVDGEIVPERALLGGPQRMLQGPETKKALTDRKAPARARADRAARGQPNDMDTIPLKQRNAGSMDPYATADALRERGMKMRGNNRGPAKPVTGERMDSIERTTSRRIPRIRP